MFTPQKSLNFGCCFPAVNVALEHTSMYTMSCTTAGRCRDLFELKLYSISFLPLPLCLLIALWEKLHLSALSISPEPIPSQQLGWKQLGFSHKTQIIIFLPSKPSSVISYYDHCSPAILWLKIRHLCWEGAWKEFYSLCNMQSTITAVEITYVLISAVFVSLTIQSGLKGDRKSRLSFSLIGCPAVFWCRDP